MTDTVADARTLYALSGEFRSFIACWVAERRCPLPLVDFLLEAGLESQAEAARWAATEPDRPVYCPMIGEREGPCGPFPTMSGMRDGEWFWTPTNSNTSADDVPQTNVPLRDLLYAPSDTDAILALLDNWRVTP